ncbi:bifunctional folylpolyglutamate synthase/dihydrofolate synthase [Caldanaerobius polysaccharolyticus]|uniref:bifunctional folylpolyglutamate synthase/dihydrofolate synthase n=1 Tax=Caldanaerobius polysaccharolyticus TaxID=44256 RepID=UPI00047C3B8D|nr:folylpolyglutamate synthase/dihydrofolate synthase family protein [Caldanaerobius polysaccharolyticus]
MTYEEAVAYIHSISKFGVKLGLENMKKLLEMMGHPDRSYKIVHVAGTNGKGSTCAMIDSVLRAAGYKTGLYTSPYLEVFNERIRINGENIPDSDLVKMVDYVKPLAEQMVKEGYNHPTEFEFITAIALKYYEIQKVDIAVLEVGLGGRFDATNSVERTDVSVITTIDMDHMKTLGNTIEKIAFEKAGIIRNNGLVVTYPQKDEAMAVIEERCRELSARLIKVDMASLRVKKATHAGEVFDYKHLKNVEIGLVGMHQVLNAATAIEALWTLEKNGVSISEKALLEGLKCARWPGRLEVLREHPFIVIDGAHNPQGASTLAKNIKDLFIYKRLILVIGVLKDKDVDGILNNIAPFADVVIATRPDSYRALDADVLAEMIKMRVKCQVTAIEDIGQAVRRAIELAGKDDMVLFCGSLYLIGHVREILRFDIIPTL